MATQTQTLRKAPVQMSRTHDYLYDNHHVLASERDHARATFKAHTGADRVKRVPVYNTMFSELRHHPRFQMRLDVTDPVPKFISRQWRGYADQHREQLIRYTTFNYDPSVQVPAKEYSTAHVRGSDRFKYFRRPIIPFLQQVPPEVLLATARHDPLAGPDMQVERPPTPLTRTIEIQTDYRDSEAQTDPYTPEYVVRPGSAPELLTLATLSHGRGLPAGRAEVEMIERARAKRAWEATLPPLNDVSQLEKRKRMMDEMERKEWALREQEIEKLQETRLEVLKQSKKQKEKESRIKKIRNEHIKTIRKLTDKRRKVEGKLERREVINDYATYGSQTYAPLTRVGIFIDRGSEQYTVKSRHLNTYQGLLELEASLPDFVTQPRIKGPKPKTVTKSGFVKRKYRQEIELMDMHETIKEAKLKGEEEPKPLRFLQKIEKPIPRPPTPTVEVPSQEEEDRELAVIFLQQVIRGRAIQNMMYEGKEKRMELIRELRSTHALQDAEQTYKKQEKQATLAKELVRLQEERRIHAFSMLAERQRRIREAEESGRRQVEERRRREEDEVFKQVIRVHQDTVDSYLTSIVIGSIDDTADAQARMEVSEYAEKINDIAYDLEDKRTQLQSEEIVADLVHCFLIPEVQKQTVREKIRQDQRRYLVAAHNEIHKDSEQVISMYPRQPKTVTPPSSSTPTPPK
ncbi:CFA91-like protein [Mya arenaria]|uniref:Cilia- and flagella-associated protein 91 n=1 Tax=Mya arenaria TaxID=6604 RepID=A0ABY7E949_MYAAR|nr:CFA91-like protein [Mya arenaria]